MTEPADELGSVTCPDCGRHVPPLVHCIECGHALARSAIASRRAFAANPREPARALRMFSTLFPHLPHHEIEGFRLALIAGGLVVAVLIAMRAFPLALVASVLVVPLLFLLYFFAVDIYEGEPLKVMAATLVWGAAVGVGSGLVSRAFTADGSGLGAGVTFGATLRDGVLVPVVNAALVAIGPLLLMRNRAFDDVLDGATFGATAAATFAATNVFIRTFDVLRGGLQPGGSAEPWILQVATIGLANPVLIASVVGSICAAFWLRYRAPVRDRSAMGLLGRPLVACLAGAVLLGVAGLGRAYFGQIGGLVAVAVPAVIALVWLRLTIHLGLREEAASQGDGPEVRCAECGSLTPRARFCGTCGVALRANPIMAGTRRSASVAKARPEGPDA